MPAKAVIQVREFPGFRVALAFASLPGMTDDLCREHVGCHPTYFCSYSFLINPLLSSSVMKLASTNSSGL